MKNYYSRRLSALNLVKCYELATPRIKEYLDAELDFALSYISNNSAVLDLGCGYGRTLPAIALKANSVTGIDISSANISLAKELLSDLSNCVLKKMNAANLRFSPDNFDVTLCLQNGISAFNIDPKIIITQSIRVTKPGGIILFSTYSEKFWNHRLDWFILQSRAGLLGEIDFSKTQNGIILCKDGFKSATFSVNDFRILAKDISNIKISFKEVNRSSLFFIINKLL
ncbi:MAG: methyltransferase domain-containing protein [Ignavibacteria bacterium]|nr:methyltransferase domain-containing protein [Ignavibacteria bacterium]